METIFIAVPVYRGKAFLPETLRSILNQTYANFRVQISIDNNDMESAEVCKEFLADHRFKMTLQSAHVGWPGNLNWLMKQCDSPFFVYWQQDDLASTNYLEALYAESIRHKSASITYTDVQWFGSKFNRDSCPSMVGNLTQRLGQAIEQISYIPFRGLIRTSALKLVDPIRPAEKYSSHNEFRFLVELAALGEFRRTDRAMYFKRAHDGNTFNTWSNWQPWKKRRSWIEMGLDFLQVAEKYLPDEFHEPAIVFIMDRLAVSRNGRGFFYLPPADGLQQFVRDFLILGNLNNPLERINEPFLKELNPYDDYFDEELKKALEKTKELNSINVDLGAELETSNEVCVEIKKGNKGNSILGYGWSIPESWGAWTDGHETSLMLPIVNSGFYVLHLRGYHYRGKQSKEEVQLFWRIHVDHQYKEVMLTSGIHATCTFQFEFQKNDLGSHCMLELYLPAAVFLLDDEIPDYRKVGFGLQNLKIEKVSPEKLD